MPLEEGICEGNHPLIESLVASLIPAGQKDRRSSRVKGEQDPEEPLFVLNPELLHVRISASGYQIHIGPSQGRTDRPEEQQVLVDRLLAIEIESFDPSSKGSGSIDRPHIPTISPGGYEVK